MKIILIPILSRKQRYTLPFIPFFYPLLGLGLTVIDVLVYGIYRSLVISFGEPLVDGRLYVTIKIKKIAELLHVSESTVKRARRHLIQFGFLEVQRAGLGRTSRTIVNDVRLLDDAATGAHDAAIEGDEAPTAEGAEMYSAGGEEATPAEGDTPSEASGPTLPENVTLTSEQYAHLGKVMREHRDAYIQHYSKRKAERGYTFPCDYDALINWWASDRERWIAGDRRKEKNRRSPKPGEAGNSFNEDDFFAAALERSFGSELPPQIMR